MRLLECLIAPSVASGTALERSRDGEHGRRSSFGLLASSPTFKGAGSGAGKAGQADRDQGETLIFESPSALFGRLTYRRWALVTTVLGQGRMTLAVSCVHLPMCTSTGMSIMKTSRHEPAPRAA